MRSGAKRQGVFRVKTPAKVTTWLKVGPKRGDGYHQVAIVLVPVSLFDELVFLQNPAGGAGLTLAVAGGEALGAVEENLVWRAARAFENETGRALSLGIRLRKGIPAGAGLGGGSGNAAGTLVALNALAGNPLGRPQLQEIAAGLGSDVPFFLEPRPALATGRGEALAPLEPFPEFSLLIVQPGFSVSTGEAYGLIHPGPQPCAPPACATFEQVLEGLQNDFQSPLFAGHPQLPRIAQVLAARGAAGSLLSGTGSAVFGIFRTTRERNAAARGFPAEPGWRVFPCQVVKNHRYLP